MTLGPGDWVEYIGLPTDHPHQGLCGVTKCWSRGDVARVDRVIAPCPETRWIAGLWFANRISGHVLGCWHIDCFRPIRSDITSIERLLATLAQQPCTNATLQDVLEYGPGDVANMMARLKRQGKVTRIDGGSKAGSIATYALVKG